MPVVRILNFLRVQNPSLGNTGVERDFYMKGAYESRMIASWPGKIKPGSKSDLISAHYDMLATFSEVAGYELPQEQDGVSILPTLLSKKTKKNTNFCFGSFQVMGDKLPFAWEIGKWFGNI